MAGSLKYGQATASLVAGKWSAGYRQNTLAAALKEWGTLRCTIRGARHLSGSGVPQEDRTEHHVANRVGECTLAPRPSPPPQLAASVPLRRLWSRAWTGAGMQAAPAVSAVLRYRLATYWLPVAPGRLCWRLLQRREYI